MDGTEEYYVEWNKSHRETNMHLWKPINQPCPNKKWNGMWERIKEEGDRKKLTGTLGNLGGC